MDVPKDCCGVFTKKTGDDSKEETLGNAILFKFTSAEGKDVAPEELARLLPGLKKAGKLETTWAIWTCHSVIPGRKFISDVEFHFNDKVHNLEELVSGCVSCCSDNSLMIIKIGSKLNLLNNPHTKSKCQMSLDFTLLFLKKQAIDGEMISMIAQPLTIPCDRKPCDWQRDILNTLNNPDQLALIGATDADLQKQKCSISNCRHRCKPVLSDSKPSLQDEIDSCVSMKEFTYTVVEPASSGNSLLPGAAVFHIKDRSTPQLVGYHVGNDVGHTIYSIIHLLQGGPVPVLSIFEHFSDLRRLWVTRWRYLLTPNESTLKDLKLSYLLELLYKLLETTTDPRPIANIDYGYPPDSRIAVLNLFSDIFVQFSERNISEVALKKQLDGECTAFAEGLKECVKKLLNKLTGEILMGFLKAKTDNEIENGYVEAYFRCLASLVNFRCDNIVGDGLSKAIEGNQLVQLYTKWCKVELSPGRNAERCTVCGSFKSKVPGYFTEILLKYTEKNAGTKLSVEEQGSNNK